MCADEKRFEFDHLPHRGVADIAGSRGVRASAITFSVLGRPDEGVEEIQIRGVAQRLFS